MPWFRDQYVDAVWESDSLRPNEVLVALVYADHAGDPDKPSNDVAWVSWPRLSQRTGIRSKDALSRALRGLEKAGWLVLVEKGKQHRSPRYRIAVPERPEVREAYVWDGEEQPPEVREPDAQPVENQAPEVRETDGSDISEVRPTDTSTTPEVRETAPEVRETTPSGTPGRHDPSTDPSTTDNPPIPRPQPQDARKENCHHLRLTADGDCMHCHATDLCRLCVQLTRNTKGLVRHCYQHQEAS